MTASPELRHMNLTYSSRCGNPECERGQLPPGSDVIVVNKRIYCSSECALAHETSTATRKPRAAAKSKSKAKASS